MKPGVPVSSLKGGMRSRAAGRKGRSVLVWGQDVTLGSGELILAKRGWEEVVSGVKVEAWAKTPRPRGLAAVGWLREGGSSWAGVAEARGHQV